MSNNTREIELLERLLKDNEDKIEAVVNGSASSKHQRFYRLLLSERWYYDRDLAIDLYNYYQTNKESIHRSLLLIGIKHNQTHQSEHINQLKPARSVFRTLDVKDNNELDIDLDKYYLNDEEFDDIKGNLEIQHSFKRPHTPVRPKRYEGRDYLRQNYHSVTNFLNKDYERRTKERFNTIPSTDKNQHKFINGIIEDFPYYNHYKPKTTINLFDKKQSKRFVGDFGTWMFDLMYFSDHNPVKVRNQVIYLVGININTRYAVIRRVEGKTTDQLIKAFEDLLSKELKNQLKYLIFDGEKAISSRAFEDYCKKNDINVRITYPGIHTQTGPIDRLCRTIRHYFKKAFIANDYEVGKANSYILHNPLYYLSKEFKHKVQERSLQINKIFETDSNISAPLPREYVEFIDEKTGKPAYHTLDMNSQNNVSGYIKTIRDEIYDIVEYYNQKPHNGLIKNINEAIELFGNRFNIDNIHKISPKIAHENKNIERMIIQCNRFYNEEVEKISTKYKIGDKVILWDVFKTDRGSLQRYDPKEWIGDWEIIGKDNEIYRVLNRQTNEIIHVSKYMIKNKR